jgi:hypothetical protein
MKPDDRDGDDRAFPSEAEWLALPLPDGITDLPSPDFVGRTLDAIAAERALDRDLDAIARDLPRIVLSAYDVPAPRPDFVDGTLARVRDARRARWQQLLARHVAPVPSTEFVQRTLEALAVDRERKSPAPHWRDRRVWVLVAAAALALFFVWPRPAQEPLQAQLAAAATPAMAHAWTSPSAVLLAADLDRRDPEALRAGAPDGVWLAFAPVPTAEVR